MKAYPEKEGYLQVDGRQVWYKIAGDAEKPGKLPVLCLHGGPGANSLYLKPLEALAAGGRRVIFYDQLGCGKSGKADPSLYTLPAFVAELRSVMEQLGLKRVHLYGQSWGGMLAMEYYLESPDTVASLVLADSLASSATWLSEANRLRAELPATVQETLLRNERDGTTASQEYQDAMMEYYGRYLCRLPSWPQFLLDSFAQLAGDVYAAMWGASEFYITGNLKDWDIRPRLGEIKVPTLVLSGRYDESTPAVSGELHRGIVGSEWVIFENSAHLPHIEETAPYLKTVEEFLSAVEKSGR